jgi:hypothetical protein
VLILFTYFPNVPRSASLPLPDRPDSGGGFIFANVYFRAFFNVKGVLRPYE